MSKERPRVMAMSIVVGILGLCGCSGDAAGSRGPAGGAGPVESTGGSATGGKASGGTATIATGGVSATGGAGGAQPSGPPSCWQKSPGTGADCGPHGDQDCCSTLMVPGGSFLRSYDGVSYTNRGYPATVSSFRLDRYEVTVGRFRDFMAAWVAGYRPAAGSGQHAHLPGGGISGETGWDPAWSSLLPATKADWDDALRCNTSFVVWTSSPADNEVKPVMCLTWYEAYAFCIRDGGFLPSEAEFSYAAAGGDEQRVYPWSEPPTSTLVDATYAVYDCRADGSNGGIANCAVSDIPDVGSRSPLGDGRWGHADLGGSAIEWVLDGWAGSYRSSDCVDCAELTSVDNRIYRSGSFVDSEAVMLAAAHDYYGGPAGRGWGTGVRCAHVP